MSVDHVLQQVRDGHLPHRLDEGFMFVNVAPHGGGCGIVKPAEVHPPTFTVLSESEVEALCDDTLADLEADTVDDREDDEESQSPSDDEASIDLADWRAVRQRVGRMRVPPGAKPQAA